MSDEEQYEPLEHAVSTLEKVAADYRALRAENEKLRAENINLFYRLDKAHSFISRADWMQFFQEEQEPAAALKETGDE